MSVLYYVSRLPDTSFEQSLFSKFKAAAQPSFKLHPQLAEKASSAVQQVWAVLSLAQPSPNLIQHFVKNKTKVLSVQLGKTLSFVKFVVEWGGVGGRGGKGGKTLDCSSLTLKRPTYQIMASCYA